MTKQITIDITEEEYKLIDKLSKQRNKSFQEISKEVLIDNVKEELSWDEFCKTEIIDSHDEHYSFIVPNSVFDELNAMMLFAFRYALGRRTYAVNIVCEYIKKNINQLNTNDIQLIIKEIQDAASNNNLGDECDKQCWNELMEWLK